MASIAGRNPVLMSLRAGRRQVHELLVANGAKDPRIRESIQLARKRGIRYRFCDARELNRNAPGVRHQGIVLLADPLPEVSLDELLDRIDTPNSLLVALDQVQDPHNLGAVLRTADAAGAQGVLVPRRHAAGYSSTISRTSAGSVEVVPLVEVANLGRALKQLKSAGYWIVGADLQAEQDHWEMEVQRPLCLVLGNEAEGLRRTVRGACDVCVHIPIPGQAESLNVSVAAGVLLYEVLRQRRLPESPP